jgi:hypothetical protein
MVPLLSQTSQLPLEYLCNSLVAKRITSEAMLKHALATFLAVAAFAASPAADTRPGGAGQAPPLSPAEVQALSQRAIANQHRNDQLLDQYERIEHTWIRKPGTNPPATQETLNRILPTGTGIMRLPLAAPGKPANPVAYHDQLVYLANVLSMVAQPDAAEQQTLERYRKRQQDRADLVTGVGNAYRFSWLGREMRDGRLLIKLQMDPNPNFHPTSPTAQVLTHVRAIVWVDESAGQMLHLEAEITSDVYFGAGILGKLYRGGRFAMDQSEVAPGVWEPTRYQYDLDGRKFLFPFGDHETTEFSQYRRVGTPAEELQAVRNELNTAATDPPRP